MDFSASIIGNYSTRLAGCDGTKDGTMCPTPRRKLREPIKPYGHTRFPQRLYCLQELHYRHGDGENLVPGLGLPRPEPVKGCGVAYTTVTKRHH